MYDWSVPSIVDVAIFRDDLGALGVIEGESTFPFSIKRVYFLYDVPSNATRGSHAHKALHQLIIPIAGSFRVTLDDGREAKEHLLDQPDKALAVPPGYWRTLTGFTAGAAALVLASEEYNTDDYIRNYDEFVVWATR
jgi:dTDP-4-dehydrorhamnose 3,5-epimerase-like enzyme